MVAGYTNAACIIYDIETGKSIVRMETLQVSVIYRLIAHLLNLLLRGILILRLTFLSQGLF